MVYFTSFTDNVQRILIQGNEAFTRSLMLFSIFIFCFVYVVYWKNTHEEKTNKFWTVGILRILVTAFSYIYLMVTPFTLLLFDPTINFYEMFIFYFGIYGLFAVLTLAILLVEAIYLGPLIMLNMGGIDAGDERVKKIVKKIFKRDLL